MSLTRKAECQTWVRPSMLISPSRAVSDQAGLDPTQRVTVAFLKE